MPEEKAVNILQHWWRKILRKKVKESWDITGDPPNWGQPSLLPISLQSDSDDGVESLFNEIEIERERYRSKNIQDIIDQLQVDLNSQNPISEDHNSSIDSNEVFEDESHWVCNINRSKRSSSVLVNVFGDRSCRANSEEFFIQKHIDRHSSVNVTEHRMLTRSRSRMQRVPLSSTPLKEHIGEQTRPPESPNGQDPDA